MKQYLWSWYHGDGCSFSPSSIFNIWSGKRIIKGIFQVWLLFYLTVCVIHALWVSGEITPGLRVFIMSFFQRALCSGVITICYAKLWAHSPPEAPCCGLLLFFCSLWLPIDQELSSGAGIALAVWKVTLLHWLPFTELWPLLLSPIERRSHWYGLSLTESLGPAWGSLPWEGVSSLCFSFL